MILTIKINFYRKTFDSVPIYYMPRDLNMVDGRIVIAVQTTGNSRECYKARFVEKLHRNKRQKLPYLQFETIRH